MLRFNKAYFALTITLFITEVLIALYVHDAIIRPYIGDLLVVILIYCFVKSFIDTPALKTAIAVLLFAYAVELSQYLNLVKHLGLQHSRLANVVMGNSFEWIDMLAYTIGAVIIVLVEYLLHKRKTNRVIRNIEL
ncbi:MAG: DUF2809 domain-containing protein [Citrobacter freundii]|nr:MAG: DUF2809 domain-containing protein [Citrobacter freundii]